MGGRSSKPAGESTATLAVTDGGTPEASLNDPTPTHHHQDFKRRSVGTKESELDASLTASVLSPGDAADPVASAEEARHGRLIAALPAPKELSAWLLNKANDPLFVAVSNPKSRNKLPFGLKKSTSYQVRAVSNHMETTVHRRYRDFAALREILLKRYSGVVPRLPARKSSALIYKAKSKKSKEEFIRARKEGLEIFIRTCARNPFYRADGAFCDFLAAPGEFMPKTHVVGFVDCGYGGSVEAGPLTVASTSSGSRWGRGSRSALETRALSSASEGEARWAQALYESPVSQHPGTDLANAVLELEDLSKRLKLTQTVFAKYGAATGAYASSCMDVADALAEWSDFERDALSENTRAATSFPAVTRAQHLDDPDAAFERTHLDARKMIGAASEMRLAHARVVRAKEAHILKTMVVPLRVEIANVEVLVAALKKARSALVARRKAVKTYHTAFDASRALAVPTAVPALAEPPTSGDDDDDEDDDTEAIEDAAAAAVTEPGVTVPDTYDADRLDKLRREACAAQRVARNVVVALMVLELGRFRVERTARLSQALYESSSSHVLDARAEATVFKRANELFPPGIPATSELQAFGEGALTARAPRVLLGTAVEKDDGACASFDRRRRSLSLGGRRGSPVGLDGRGLEGLRTTDSANASVAGDSGTSDDSDDDGDTRASAPPLPSAPPAQTRLSLRAVFAFTAENDDELDLTVGQILTGSIDPADPEWYRVTSVDKSTGAKTSGLVPKGFVEEVSAGRFDDDADADDDADVVTGPARPLPPKSGSGRAPPAKKSNAPPPPPPQATKPTTKPKPPKSTPPSKKRAAAAADAAPRPPAALLGAIQGFDAKKGLQTSSSKTTANHTSHASSNKRSSGAADGAAALKAKLAARRAAVDSDAD